ncbi:MAG: hypothetical protein KTR15_05390 [Phycisphaeraceae bacterium]|nr:hypothetical protein [Phycisphaeraceae bacterium]
MAIETKLMMICLLALAAALVYGVLKVLGAWYEQSLARHDLVVESKRRRYAYFKALADREREIQGEEAESSVIIEEDEPQLAQAA